MNTKDWSNRCYMCAKDMADRTLLEYHGEPTEKHIVKSIKKLKKHPDYVGPMYTHIYCVCTGCFDKGKYI